MATSAKISWLEVASVMCDRDLDIRFSGLENVTEMRLVKKGTKVTIGFPGDVLNGIANGKFIGGFILLDQAQFKAIKDELAVSSSDGGQR